MYFIKVKRAHAVVDIHYWSPFNPWVLSHSTEVTGSRPLGWMRRGALSWSGPEDFSESEISSIPVWI